MIRKAIAIMRTLYGDPPAQGCVTFVDEKKTRGVLRRGERVHGFCYLMAGFRLVGQTKGGLLAWQMLPEYMPAPLALPEAA
jgi:hypothetical protein